MALSRLRMDAPWASPTAITLSCAVVMLGYLAMPSAQDRAVRHLPTPSSYLPILRNTLVVARAQKSGRFLDWILDHCRRWGGKPWCFRIVGKPPMIVICSPEAFEDVLKTQFESFEKLPHIYDAMKDVMGQGILAVSGPMWRHLRKTASHLFTSQRIQDAMDAVVVEKCAALVKRLDFLAAQEDDDNHVVTFKRLMDLFTMDIFAKVGFGIELHGIENNENAELLDSFGRVGVRVQTRTQQPAWVWKLMRWLNVGEEKQMAQDMKLTNDLTYSVIFRNMEEKNRGKSADRSSQKDLISLLLDAGDVEFTPGERIEATPQMLRDFVIAFLAAGRETTAQAISWIVLMMNRYPKVLDKVRQELKDKVPGLASDEQVAPSVGDIHQLVFLEAVIRETLRLFPIGTASGRSATHDLTLYDGTFIRAGTHVLLPHYSMGRMKTVWGPDVEEFKPERWVDTSTGKLIAVSPFKFSAFSAGPRICVGMKFAMSELKMALAMLLSRFDLQSVRDPFDYTYDQSFTLQIKGDLDVKVTRVKL